MTRPAPEFRLPGTLAGLARGLSEPGAVAERARSIVKALAEHPTRRTGPAVDTLQLLDHLAVTRHGRQGAEAPSIPGEVMQALAAALNVEDHVRHRRALEGSESNAALGRELGVDGTTIGRWRSKPLASSAMAGESALAIADRGLARHGSSRAPGAAEALYDLADAEVAAGRYFSSEMLWALAEALLVATRARGMSQAAVEHVSEGLREPDKFIATGLAEGASGASVRGVAAKAGVDRKQVREWRSPDSPHHLAHELNKLAGQQWDPTRKRKMALGLSSSEKPPEDESRAAAIAQAREDAELLRTIAGRTSDEGKRVEYLREADEADALAERLTGEGH